MNRRATIITDTDLPEQHAAFEVWLEKWGDRMDFVSGNSGCGCCVCIYNVEGPEEAIEAIPERLRSDSDWVRGGKRG